MSSLNNEKRCRFYEGFASLLQVKQAIKLLDKNNDNLIQFSEFVDWWQNEVREPALWVLNFNILL